MMKPDDPRELAIDILERSICSVKVGACVADATGILSWGWNSVGSGNGLHAERHAVSRANKARLKGATIYVAAFRTGRKVITAKPCTACQLMIDQWGLKVVYRNMKSEWIML